MANSGYCAWCAKKVERFSTRGKPFKYCTPECDKQAMAKIMREFKRKVIPVPRKTWFEKVKTWFQA